jgi:phosphoribosylformylglycinamidine synthase
MDIVKRIYAEKKEGFNVEGREMSDDLKLSLGLTGIKDIRIINRYDIEGIEDDVLEKALCTIFSEPQSDNLYKETFPVKGGTRVFATEFLPGQYDQRADSAVQCMQLISEEENIEIRFAKVFVIDGDISEEDFIKIKEYSINKVDSREASLKKPASLKSELQQGEEIKEIDNFITMTDNKLEQFHRENGFAMSFPDIMFCRDYFRDTEKRNPTWTEIKVIDTYWSDHCRHTTFSTIINDVEIEEGKYKDLFNEAYEGYLESRKYVYGERKKDINLMDIAVIGMKELSMRGFLNDLDVSEEINACSIEIPVVVNDKEEKWLLMFKNETHNHPTEIEPFGGAATCLGGAIRDPLSGRAYVYQAMRITGSSDPREKIEDTLPGKLPQRKITQGAAHGYSSYGNQIGLATGQVTEVYHPGFKAKRMELGAVIGAVPKENVIREKAEEGDIIILLGGRTGRDGCGGATGSSKEHDEESISKCGAEVQKGNPPTERKIQRLFRKKEVSRLIKKCNDFGAGGVAVAIGELADSLYIDLSMVPKKYEGLDGTELAISESQERMAVVVDIENSDKFIEYAKEENLEATKVAYVTCSNRLQMALSGKMIVDLSRDFLNTNGVSGTCDAKIEAPDTISYLDSREPGVSLQEKWINVLKNINVCSQKGLAERFDSTIGAGSVLLPFGGKYQRTPEEGMAALLPVLEGECDTASVMTYGYNPYICSWSPFHGAVYSIVESLTKVAALGGDYRKVRLSFQEYFMRLGKEKENWGKPLSALLAALYTQKKLNIPAIGGKDSMSGTFKDVFVPPTLVSIAATYQKADKIISSSLKKSGSKIFMLRVSRLDNDLPDFDELTDNFDKISSLNEKGYILSSRSIRDGGIAEALSKMAFGNKIGVKIYNNVNEDDLFKKEYGSIIIEIKDGIEIEKELSDINYLQIGETIKQQCILYKDLSLSLDYLYNEYEKPLENIFKTKTRKLEGELITKLYNDGIKQSPAIKTAKPKIFIPVFPGTNCEYDSKRAFEKAGGEADVFVFRNGSLQDIKSSIEDMVKIINKSNIIMIPGGFSAGDEPEGSGKFIAAVFRNEYIKEAVMELLYKRDGLMLGICNGFQALVKLGLVPFGDIREMQSSYPTLTFNNIGRHVSKIVRTKVVSNLSPWFSNVNVGDVHSLPVSHGEGRFIVAKSDAERLFAKGQVSTVYVDDDNNPSLDIEYNPNGSSYAIEGITSIDGRILGKMGHSERTGAYVSANIYGEKDQKIFQAGVSYFK